jgi:acyl carrier protein
MTQAGVEHIKSLMASILEPRLVASGMALASLSDDLDLRDEGIVDSLGFVELITELEVRLGDRIDLADLDPAQLTNVGALARHIVAAGSVHHV